MDIQQLVRKNIQSLVAYSSARDEFSQSEGVFLDANENPFGTRNRYPDPMQKLLKEKIALQKKCSEKHIVLGNGSDEIIDLAIRIFCNPGKDNIIICPPTYGMYQVCASINDVQVKEIPLLDNFQLDTKEIGKLLEKNDARDKIIFLCSPNNPSGNDLNDIEFVLKRFKGIVFLDEAYIDFSQRESYLSTLSSYPNLIISQTFSKAWGLAAVRIGMAFCSQEIASLYNKVKPPYNISSPNQQEALKALENKEQYEKNRQILLEQKQILLEELQKTPCIEKVSPSDANFLLVRVKNPNEIYQQLVEKKIIIRNRASVVAGSLRITVGTEQENRALLEELKRF